MKYKITAETRECLSFSYWSPHLDRCYCVWCIKGKLPSHWLKLRPLLQRVLPCRCVGNEFASNAWLTILFLNLSLIKESLWSSFVGLNNHFVWTNEYYMLINWYFKHKFLFFSWVSCLGLICINMAINLCNRFAYVQHLSFLFVVAGIFLGLSARVTCEDLHPVQM